MATKRNNARRQAKYRRKKVAIFDDLDRIVCGGCRSKFKGYQVRYLKIFGTSVAHCKNCTSQDLSRIIK